MRGACILLSLGALLAVAPAAADPPAGPTLDFEPPPMGVMVRWASPRLQKVSIKASPARGARTIGEVWAGSELLIAEAGPGGRGCHSWLAVVPAGHVCADEMSLRVGPFVGPDGAAGDEGPHRYRYAFARIERVPLFAGPSAIAPARWLNRGDGLTIVEGSGRAMLRTTGRMWVRRSDVEIGAPTRLRGLELRALPARQRFQVGWLVPGLHEDSVSLVVPARIASGSARPVVEELQPTAPYTPVLVLGPGAAGRSLVQALGAAGALRGEVVERHLRRVAPAPLPPDIAPGERWIDISLASQVAVAYEGTEPVFAALVSTAPHGGTPPGTYAVYRKYRTQTMANLAGSRSVYDFRRVPHAQFFHGRFGLHAALWHDHFGHPVSHGCVNLSPPDAERLFQFTGPALPPGWHAVTSSSGSRIVVRR